MAIRFDAVSSVSNETDEAKKSKAPEAAPAPIAPEQPKFRSRAANGTFDKKAYMRAYMRERRRKAKPDSP